MSHHRNVDNSTPLRSTNDARHQKLMSGRTLSAVRSGPWLAMMLFALLVVRAAMFPCIVVAQQSAPAKATEDLPRGAMQAKASSSCLECHEARIILQQRLSKAAWTNEVDKMIKWGAVVDTSDHDALIDYLSSHFSPDRPSYEPPRTSSRKHLGNSDVGK